MAKKQLTPELQCRDIVRTAMERYEDLPVSELVYIIDDIAGPAFVAALNETLRKRLYSFVVQRIQAGDYPMPGLRHRPLPQLTDKDAERFWSKVDRRGTDECWPWVGGSQIGGYGVFHASKNDWAAHRISFYIATGIDPGASLICHSCDAPACCNPAHLAIGTDSDNMRQMVKRGRHNRPTGDKHWARRCPEKLAPSNLPKENSGELNSRAKLTWEQVDEIRARYKPGEITHMELAAIYGMKKSMIGNILTYKSWVKRPH